MFAIDRVYRHRSRRSSTTVRRCTEFFSLRHFTSILTIGIISSSKRTNTWRVRR
ncbi:hypothetical protein [Pseudomonas phage PhL_UNISO_PA-DSM_ph0031]|nr:hypothetical protein [Pseudomonas phage PhL_UNISO_PA-DSM_ph0031]